MRQYGKEIYHIIYYHILSYMGLALDPEMPSHVGMLQLLAVHGFHVQDHKIKSIKNTWTHIHVHVLTNTDLDILTHINRRVDIKT